MLAEEAVHPKPRGAFGGGIDVLRIAAPGVCAQVALLSNQAGANRVQMDVIANAFEVTRAAAINQKRFVAPAEKMAEEFVAAVEPGGVGAEKPLHAGHKVRARGFRHEMKMIVHQAIGMNLPAGLLASFAQCFQE